MVFNCLPYERDTETPSIHPTQKAVPLLRFLIETFTDKGEWVYGFLADILSDRAIIAPEGTALSKAVIIDTVGQFTGFRAKNWIDVYEGDIVEFKVIGMDSKKLMKYVGVVVFRNGEFIVTRNGESYAIYSIFNGGASVIGNIHNNPELLNPETP